LHQAPQVVQISRQAVQAVHDNRIALTREGQERLELRSFGVLARGFVGKDLVGINLNRQAKNVVRFYNKRGTAEQWIKEGKLAITWTRLSCHGFRDNEVRLQLFSLTYNVGNFLRILVLPRKVGQWTLTTIREKLIKIGAKVVRHAKYVTFQLAEVAIPRSLFAMILDKTAQLRPAPETG
jgi:hypothetical protein